MTQASEKPTVQSAGMPTLIGDRMEDGTVFAGISANTGKPFYALPADAPLIVQWERAMEYAAAFEGNGHPAGTFRLPGEGELNVMFNNRARIGGFNETGSFPAGHYWSSTESHTNAGYAWDQRFVDGSCAWRRKSVELSLRLVRD